jgi:hypothetical protein
MGFKGERASLNQYSLIKDYLIESGAVAQVKRVYELTENFYRSVERDQPAMAEIVETNIKKIKVLPVIAFDAGMARFFKDSPYEVVVLKVAGGAAESVRANYKNLLEPTFTHVFTGLVKNPRVFAEMTKSSDTRGAAILGAQEMSRLFDGPIFFELNELMNELFTGDFRSEIEGWLGKSKKLPEIDNLARELAEWFFVLRAAKQTSDDVLIVKDGSLITNQFGSGQALATRLDSFFKGEVASLGKFVVGVVKESRFIKDEGHVVSKTIRDFSKLVPGNQFFRIPYGLEVLLDATTIEDKAVERLFLSVASGKNVFEIQFPKSLTSDPEAFERARATVISQVTSLYGGSVAANSLAHRAASLSEAEARSLEKEIRFTTKIKK